jgi:uncharacterized protein with GYD domain
MKTLLVEPAYLVPADASGQDRDMIEVRVLGHGRHRGVQVHVDELSRQVVIKYCRQNVLTTRTRHPYPPIAPVRTSVITAPAPLWPVAPGPGTYGPRPNPDPAEERVRNRQMRHKVCDASAWILIHVTRPQRGGTTMAKYLSIASYTQEGIKGLMAKGGTARVEASRRVLADAGGTLEGFYFALGADDVYIVCDLPDNVAAAATAMSAAASGMVVNRMVALLTADEVDRAAKLRPRYDAPGS